MAGFRDARRPCAPASSHPSRRGGRALLAVGAALLALLLPAAIGAAWTTNLAALDDGACGQSLQIGSDRTASSSAMPSFVLMGDGGLSSYAISIDGRPIGTFHSAGNGIVCIATGAPLADGPHLLTGNELAPRSTYVVTPLAFSVDTVPPTSPSQPVLSGYKDSGVQGDGITRFRSVNFAGTATPNDSVQLSSGVTVVGGARADAGGGWSATTVTLPDGTYTVAARSLDSAGNRSALSRGTRLTIDSTAPATPAAPTLEETGSPPPAVGGVAGAGVASILVFSDGVQIGAAVPGRLRDWRFTLPPLAPGLHAITIAAADAADNVSPRSTALSVTGADDPPAPPESESRPAVPDPVPLEVTRRPPRHSA